MKNPGHSAKFLIGISLTVFSLCNQLTRVHHVQGGL